ncbi:MAG: hypothetical protein LBD20_02005 [Spirochaetaceae bacterium]|jgi:hypothetical protein|nr:hypothetical protein [Spirochaetaceae bacterium]
MPKHIIVLADKVLVVDDDKKTVKSAKFNDMNISNLSEEELYAVIKAAESNPNGGVYIASPSTR